MGKNDFLTPKAVGGASYMQPGTFVTLAIKLVFRRT